VIFLVPRNAKALKCIIAAGEGIGSAIVLIGSCVKGGDEFSKMSFAN
jgi:hypothetical protein